MPTERVAVIPKLEWGTFKRFFWYAVILVFAVLIAHSMSRSEFGAARERARQADERMNAEGRYLKAWEKAQEQR